MYAALARQIRQHAHPLKPPVALISGGETTVTIRGKGRGGRCSEFLLSLAIELDGLDARAALAADTDGIDGSEDNAGALLAPDSLARAARAGASRARRMLADNDGYGFFAALGDLVVTGPTRTNVNDYRIISSSRRVSGRAASRRRCTRAPCALPRKLLPRHGRLDAARAVDTGPGRASWSGDL